MVETINDRPGLRMGMAVHRRPKSVGASLVYLPALSVMYSAAEAAVAACGTM